MQRHKENTLSKINVLAASAIILGLSITLLGCSSSPATKPTSVAQYELQAKQFKPTHGLAATNRNDVRLFVYQWFTHFEHASTADYYLGHLDDKNMSVVVPGMAPLTSHAAFAGWYNNLIAQTLWNFHDISTIQVTQTAEHEFQVDFLVDWYGEVRPESDQLAAWKSRADSNLYHYKLRQVWTVEARDQLVIKKLTITGADSQ